MKSRPPFHATARFRPLLLATFAMTALAGSAGATTVLLDFGDTATSGNWNNINAGIATVVGNGVANLITNTGTPSGIGFTMIARFGGANAQGTNASALYPGTATADSMYGNTETFSGRENVFPEFKLTNLVAGQLYYFTFFASRTGVTDNRETLYTITGSGVTSTALNASNNITNVATSIGVTPDASGEIVIRLTPGPNNTNTANHFTYLGVLEINTVPEPGSIALAGLGGLLLMRRRR